MTFLLKAECCWHSLINAVQKIVFTVVILITHESDFIYIVAEELLWRSAARRCLPTLWSCNACPHFSMPRFGQQYIVILITLQSIQTHINASEIYQAHISWRIQSGRCNNWPFSMQYSESFHHFLLSTDK